MSRAHAVVASAVLASLLVSSVGLAAPPQPGAPQGAAAKPANVDEARQHFQRALALYKKADYRAAIVEFQAAYDASPSYKLHYNIGQTQAQVSDYVGAITSFKAYLAGGGAAVPKARREEVEAELGRLTGRVALLKIVVNEPDAEVVVEGERTMTLGRSPLAEPVMLNGGAWTVRAKKDGFEAAEEKLTLAGGDKVTMQLALRPPAAPPPPAPPPEPVRPVAVDVRPKSSLQPPAREASMTPVWLVGGATLVLAAGATTTGVLALSAKSDYDKDLAALGVAPSDLSSTRSRTKSFALATDVLGGAAIVGAAVTIILYVTRGPKAAAAGDVGFDARGVYGSF